MARTAHPQRATSSCSRLRARDWPGAGAPCRGARPRARSSGAPGRASAGSVQARSPSSVITAGATTMRTTSTSIRIAAARPRPIVLTTTSGSETKPRKTLGHDHAGGEDDPADARHARTTLCCGPRAAQVLLADPRLQEDVVVHRQPEEDREHEQRDERDDRDLAVDAEQARPRAALEDEHDDAVGGGDREQVEGGGDERHPERAEHRHQQQDAEPDDQRDEERQPAGDLVGEVLEGRGGAADVDVDLRAARWRPGARRRAAVDELGGALVLRRALRDHGQDRAASPPVEAVPGHERRRRGRARRPARRGCRVAAGAVRAACGREHERAVEAGPEALGQPVVGDAGGRAGAVVAVVGLAEAQRGERHASRTSTSVPTTAATSGRRVISSAQRAKRCEGATCSGRLGRSRRAKAPISIGRTVTAPTATVATMIAEPTPIRPTNGMPGGQQAGDRDDDDRSRRDDRGAGGRVRDARGVVDAVAARQLLAVAPDDQQRVVDARAEAEHHAERRREAREVREGAGRTAAASGRRRARSAPRSASAPSPPPSGRRA